VNRRKFLAAAGVTTALTLAAAPLRAVTASQGCFRGAAGTVRCVSGFAGVPAMPPQPCRSLCWASCLAYMLQGYGAAIDLPDVLARYDLDGACRPHDDRRRLLRAAGTWTDTRGRPFLVQVTDLASLHGRHPLATGAGATLDRLARQPLLCGAAGHTTLITEIETTDGAVTWLRRERITVADPYAATPPVRDLTEDELAQPFWVLGLSLRAL
jgi:hypothetical protein